MKNPLKYFLDKDRRIGILQVVYIFFEFSSILLFAIILILGVFDFLLGIKQFLSPQLLSGSSSRVFDQLIKDLLSSFEILFLAPIPLLIIASFKRIIIKMYPIDVKIHPTIKKDMISELDAKKTFISSLIGVTATFILGQFIELFTENRLNSSDINQKSLIQSDYFYILFYILILMIIFLLIQIFLYSILSKIPKEKE